MTNNAINIPVIYQFRMSDYYGVGDLNLMESSTYRYGIVLQSDNIIEAESIINNPLLSLYHEYFLCIIFFC